MHVEPIIQVRDVWKSFGAKEVLRGVSLDVAPGQVFALLGPNGAGKTTLIRILTTLTRPDAGTARVAGHDVATAPHEVRRAISFTGQATAVDELLTGQENLVMMGRLAGYSRPAAMDRARMVLAQFDLAAAADQQVRRYSGGMRRRLDLAISLLAAPAVIFLDEPTTGLDPRSRLALWEMITELATGGTTIFLTTQYLEEADHLADRIAVIDRGVVVAEGTPAALKARVGGEVVEVRDAADEVLQAVPTDGTVAGLQAVIDQIDPAHLPGVQITIRKPTLDDVFLTLTDAGTASRPALMEAQV